MPAPKLHLGCKSKDGTYVSVCGSRRTNFAPLYELVTCRLCIRSQLWGRKDYENAAVGRVFSYDGYLYAVARVRTLDGSPITSVRADHRWILTLKGAVVPTIFCNREYAAGFILKRRKAGQITGLSTMDMLVG